MNAFLRHRAWLLTILALAVAFPLMRNAGDTRYDEEPGVRTELPERVGSWRGEPLRYCTGVSCQKVWKLSELAGATNCPTCGSALDKMALAESALLPRDTVLARSDYEDAGRSMIATIVMSGRERGSIHRPETCLSYPGNEIIGAETMEVPLAGRGPLSLRVLTSRHTTGSAVSYSYYAYWFVAKGHETSSHIERLFWMAWDRVVHNTTHRWAYIAVAGEIKPGSDEHLDELRAFVRDLYPELARR